MEGRYKGGASARLAVQFCHSNKQIVTGLRHHSSPMNDSSANPCRGHRPILSVIDSLGPGGAQRHLMNLCRALNSGPFGMDVFALHGRDPVYGAEIEAAGSRVFFGGKDRNDLRAIVHRLAKIIRDGDYRALHLYLEASTLLGTVIGTHCGVPTILTTVCARKGQFGMFPLSFRNYKWLEPWIKCYLTSVPRELAELGIPESKITFSGFALDSLAEPPRLARGENPLAQQNGLESAFPIVLSVGRLHPDKGHEFAVRGLSQVLPRFRQAALVILGVGPDENRLRNLASTLGLGSHVIFGGFHKDLRGFYSLADIYVHLAVNEGVNLAQIQAMAYGLPSLRFALGELGYRGPGLEEACIELPPGNVAAVAQALIRLSECPGRRRELGRAAQAYARHYDSLSAVKTYEKTYDGFCRQ